MKVSDKKLRKMVDKRLAAFGLQQWDIDIERGKGNFMANIRVQSLYLQGIMTVNFDEIKDMAELDDTIRHECLHIIVAPFEDVLEVLRPLLAKNEPLETVVDQIFTAAAERSIAQIEHILDIGAGQTLKVDKGSK